MAVTRMSRSSVSDYNKTNRLSGKSDFTPQATGGTTYTDTVSGVTYKYHVFTASGDFVVTNPHDGLFNYILIAGGGSGGGGFSSNNAESGGGGGGGVIFGSAKLTAGTYPVVIGAGGASSGYHGSDTTFNGETALGGGPGDDIEDGTGNMDGGSGGGGINGGAGGSGVDGQGRDGGDSTGLTAAGFGGGFGMAGQGTSKAGDGVYLGTWVGAGNGYGLAGLSFADGWFAGGGGGRGDSNGGLGTDSVYGANSTGTDASANTGGGGAGSYGNPGANQQGSLGGSGIVFVYYEVIA